MIDIVYASVVKVKLFSNHVHIIYYISDNFLSSYMYVYRDKNRYPVFSIERGEAE